MSLSLSAAVCEDVPQSTARRHRSCTSFCKKFLLTTSRDCAPFTIKWLCVVPCGVESWGKHSGAAHVYCRACLDLRREMRVSAPNARASAPLAGTVRPKAGRCTAGVPEEITSRRFSVTAAGAEQRRPARGAHSERGSDKLPTEQNPRHQEGSGVPRESGRESSSDGARRGAR